KSYVDNLLVQFGRQVLDALRDQVAGALGIEAGEDKLFRGGRSRIGAERADFRQRCGFGLRDLLLRRLGPAFDQHLQAGPRFRSEALRLGLCFDHDGLGFLLRALSFLFETFKQGGRFLAQPLGLVEFGPDRRRARVEHSAHQFGNADIEEEADHHQESDADPDFRFLQIFHAQLPVTARTAFAASSLATFSPVRRATIATAASCAAFMTCVLAAWRDAWMRASALAISAWAASSASCLARSTSPAMRFRFSSARAWARVRALASAA